MRIQCKKGTTCRIDTWRGGKSSGGSEKTMDRTYGMREAVDKRGVQPLEPRKRCASLKKPSVSLERKKETGEVERKRKQHVAHRAAPTQQHNSSNSNSPSKSSISSSGSTITALNTIMKERITDGIVSQPLHPETGGLRRSEHHCRSGGARVRWHSCRMLSWLACGWETPQSSCALVSPWERTATIIPVVNLGITILVAYSSRGMIGTLTMGLTTDTSDSHLRRNGWHRWNVAVWWVVRGRSWRSRGHRCDYHWLSDEIQVQHHVRLLSPAQWRHHVRNWCGAWQGARVGVRMRRWYGDVGESCIFALHDSGTRVFIDDCDSVLDVVRKEAEDCDCLRDERRRHIRSESRLAWACWLPGEVPDPGCTEAHCARASHSQNWGGTLDGGLTNSTEVPV